MNGNRHTLLLVILALVLAQGCGLFKRTPDTPRERPDRPVKDTTIGHTDTLPVDPKDPDKPDPRKGETYSIAIMLPFSVDEGFMGEFDKHQTRYRPLVATELYQGMLMALEDLDTVQSRNRLEVQVFDSRNSTSELEYLLAQRAVSEAGLWIGPLFPEPLRVAAGSAARQRTYLVSPLISHLPLDGPNPWYINFNPTVEAQCEALADYLVKKHAKDNLIVVRTQADRDHSLARIVVNHLRDSLPFTEVQPVKELELTSNARIDSSAFKKSGTNWVIATTYNEVFINNLLRELDKLREAGFHIRLAGMPGWLDQFESLRLDHLDNLGLLIPAPYHVNRKSPAYLSIAERYRTRYGISPTEQVCRGYDLMMYFGTNLLHLGGSMGRDWVQVPQTVGGSIQLTPVGEYGEEVRYWVNRNITLLQYSNFTLKPVTGK